MRREKYSRLEGSRTVNVQNFGKIKFKGYIWTQIEQFPIIIFLISNKKKLLSAYTETTLNGDFNPKSVIISKNTNTEKNFLTS